MRPQCLIQEDAVTLRGIVDLLEQEEADSQAISLTQHVTLQTARRLCKKLLMGGIIERKTVTRVIFGMAQQVPQAEWQLISPVGDWQQFPEGMQ